MDNLKTFILGSRRRIAIIALLLAIGIPLTVSLVGKQQEIRQRAQVSEILSTTLRPIGNGAINQWVPFLCLRNWACVSGETIDRSYVLTGAANQTDLYDLPSSNIPTGSTITNVTVKATAVGAGLFKIVIGSNGQNSPGDPLLLKNTYATYSRSMDQNPTTNAAWTVDEINSLQIGVATGVIAAPLVNQVWAEIKYAVPPPIPTSNLTPQPTIELPSPTCTPRLPCLDTEPRCLLSEPIGGWCPSVSVSPTIPVGCHPDPLNPGEVICIEPTIIFPTSFPTPTPLPTCIPKPDICDNPLIGAFPRECSAEFSQFWCPRISPTAQPTITVGQCILKTRGDANCDGRVNTDDFNVWRDEFLGVLSSKSSDFNNDGTINTDDFNIWRDGFLNQNIPH